MMEEWNDGRMEEWKNGIIRQFGNSTPDSYRGGYGGIEERKDGMKERKMEC
jgi:hypothetical protein